MSETASEAKCNNISTIDLECPICKQCYINPRVYPQCGHSACEECHRDYDNETDCRNAHTLCVYKCPMCRKTTLQPWFRRNVNQSLKALASAHPDYNVRQKYYDEVNVVSRDIASDFDLGKMAQNERIRVALEVYDELIPLLYDEALTGNPTVYIECKDTIKKMEICLDILSVMLFRHNIYKVVVRPREATIHFTRTSGYHNREYINPRHNLTLVTTSHEAVADEDEDEDDTPEVNMGSSLNSLTTEASTLQPRALFTSASALLNPSSLLSVTGRAIHPSIRATTLSSPPPPPPPPSALPWRYSLRDSRESSMRHTMDILRTHRNDIPDE